MTKNSIENLEDLLQRIEPPIPPENVSVQLEQQQQEGNEPDALVEELQRTKRLENDRYRAENKHWEDIYELRKENIPKLYWMVVCWLIFVAGCVVLTGLQYFKLSDAVLIALITTTTATVIGLFIIVLQWLFPTYKK